MSKTEIAFSYAGYIWVANRDGSNLRRITSGGHEGKPLFSPDGLQIAFSDQQGTVYVVPSAGGEPHRLTYHQADIGAVGWTPDGKRILFSSERYAFVGGVIQLFTVPVEGGFATEVPLFRASEGSFSPDGARIAYVPGIPGRGAWKHYRGGATRRIWIANLDDSSIQAKILRDNSNDFNPMWIGDKIYFLSDRNGPVTLFSYDLRSRQVKQLVKNNGFDFKSASATSDAIIYEQFGSLHLFDLKSGVERLLDIRPVVDLAGERPHFVKIDPSKISFADISPTGARAVFGVRGRILTVPAGKGDIRDVSRTRNIDDRDPAWSPNGKFIAYFSDESGEYALHVRDQSGLGKARTINFRNPTFYYSPTWSPDSKKIAYTDKELNYWYVDLQKRTPVRIDTGIYVDVTQSPEVAWSPDSRWIAYTKLLPNYLHAVFLYSLEQGKSYQVTDGMSDALYVALSKDGKYLFFTASTDVGLGAALGIDMSSFLQPVTRSVYAVVLNKHLPSPLDDEPRVGHVDKPNKEKADEERTEVEIDIEGLRERIVALPIPARNYYGLFSGEPGVVYLIAGPEVEPIPFNTNYGSLMEGPPTKVYKFDLKTRKTDRILADVASYHRYLNVGYVTSFHVSFNGESLLYRKQGRWFITPAEQSGEGLPQRGRGESLNLENMKVYVDPRAEWKHMYQQVWRDERDFFYDPGLHGLNLEAVKKKYAPFLENVSTRDDLNYLFNEMLGNIVVSHLGARGGDIDEPSGRKVGLLGADYAIHDGRYRFVRIFGGDPWNPKIHAPLTQPGAEVRVGEYLLAVNGHEIRPPADIYSYFEGTVGKQVVLKVGPRSDGVGSRDVTVIPVDNETPLRNYAWVEGNRRKVDEMTGGRVAYIYLHNTGGAGYRAFNRYYFAQVGKQAAIVDERYNGGGWSADYIIDYLHRSLLSYWHLREGKDITSPMEGIFGPKVMIINEMDGSGGDLMPWMFRHEGVGPLIGERTEGGLVGLYPQPYELLDGGFVSTPNLAFYNLNGSWDIENHGVSPDVEVEDNPQAERAGHDPQLERAIEVVLRLLKATPPPPAPHHSPFPNYSP